MTARGQDLGRGPRIIVPFGGVRLVLTIAEATELRDKLVCALASVIAQEAIVADRLAPGVMVEWDPWPGGPPMRATIHRIECGRVYVRRPKRRTKANPKAYQEGWFDPDEISTLRVVPT